MSTIKLNKGFLVHHNGEESLVVSTGAAAFSGMIRTNRTAARIIGCLEEGADREQIIHRLAQQYDAPTEQIAGDVDRVLDQLRQIGAIDD